jgi:hypothetical protein
MPGGVVRIEIHGEEQADRIARRLLRKAGSNQLARDLHTAMRFALAGTEAEIRASARRLPSRNGLAADVATSRIRVTTAANGNKVRALITARHEYNLAGLDRGTNVHPLFGNRRHWYRQAVRPRWFTDPAKDKAADVRNAIQKAVKAFAATL